MSNGCFVGRGRLLVSVLGASRGFFTLSGESEITLEFEEDNESIFDARHGVNERIDWYPRNYRCRLTADCFRIEKSAIELLLKSNYNNIAGSAAPIVLPNPITLGEDYFLRPNITPGSLSVTSPAPAVVAPAAYEVDYLYGSIRFNATVPVQPYTVALTTTAYDQYSLHADKQIFVQARVNGYDKASQRNFAAHFYRLALDITEELILVQKPFSRMTVRMQATPDVSQPLDPVAGQYGRIMFL